MKAFAIRPEVRLALVIAAFVAATIAIWPRSRPIAFFLEMNMSSSLPGSARLYYDARQGLLETDSHQLALAGGSHEKTYRFPLPEGRYSNLRLDATTPAGNKLTLSRPRIIDRSGEIIRSIQTSQLKTSCQVERSQEHSTDSSLTIVSTEDCSNVSVELNEPLSLMRFPRQSMTKILRRFARCFVVIGALALITIPLLLPRCSPPVRHRATQIRTWSIKHPQRAVLVIATLFVTLSCYPVIFFGKSFVSPNNQCGTTLLYGSMPTVPGYRAIATDDEKGADIGATMWQNWPYSVVENRSLRQFGELPLWNRYNSCGLPLLGQGLSSFGDPLQLLPLLTRGSSIAWDLKYLLAKLLFAACLGLAALQLTRHLPAALVLSASAPFIGFFSYRYSHPAFFALCYAPSILLCWFKLIDARPGRRTVGWLAALILADWSLLNSGTAKEAYVLLLAMNGCGFLTLLLARSVDEKPTKLLQAAFASILFAAISMPVWSTFFHSLKRSFTAYDAGGAEQLQPSLLIGLFDDIFYRQFNISELHLDPSANFLVLLAVAWFVLSPSRPDQRRLSRGLSVTCVIALLFVFGVVPPSLIVRLPLLRNIVHVDNTFSCVAIVCLLLIAGFGIKTFWEDCRSADFKRLHWRVTILLLLLAALYLGATQAAQRSSIAWIHFGEQIPRSPFFWGYFLSLMIAAIAMPWLTRRVIVTNRSRALPFLLVTILFFIFHWRHGMHLEIPFDAYVMNPQQRVNLVADSSPTIKWLTEKQTEPSRSAGLNPAFFPGYGGAVGIEQIDGPDPLLNPNYRALFSAFGVKLIFGSWFYEVTAKRLQQDLPLFNMLNVRYFLADLGTAVQPIPFLKKVDSLDMDVYESEQVWPRAFFTERVTAYQNEEDLVPLIRMNAGTPFAGIPQEELRDKDWLAQQARPLPLEDNRRAIPATDYRLTNNTTSFRVKVSGPGVIVLTETLVPEDFRATLNGSPVDHFRVNGAFKGIYVDHAGDYLVSFSYWPRYFTASLWVAGLGLAIFLVWSWFLIRGNKLAPVHDIFQKMKTANIDGHSMSDIVGGGDPEQVAREVVGAIHKFAHLNAHDSILDIGCGCGRIATALTQYINRNGRYLGVDIVPGLIGFANKFITPRYPNFKFVLLNESNTTYDWWRRSNSEQGIATLADIPDLNGIDLALCVSVLTHLDYDKAFETLTMIQRALKNQGRAFVTLFLLDDHARNGIEQRTANLRFTVTTPSGKLYSEKSDDPTFAVAYDRERLDQLLRSSGLHLEQFVRGYWSGGPPRDTFQDALILRKTSL